MSTQVNTYVLWGLILPYEEVNALPGGEDSAYDRAEPYTDSAFDEDVNPKNEVTILFDGMNGKYVAVGHVIAKTRDYGHFHQPVTLRNPSIHASPDIPLSEFGLWKAGIGKALEDLGYSYEQVEGREIGWHVISHYR